MLPSYRLLLSSANAVQLVHPVLQLLQEDYIPRIPHVCDRKPAGERAGPRFVSRAHRRSSHHGADLVGQPFPEEIPEKTAPEAA
ncbi:unnamed protein product [Nesidiocoris tenuis]|uniref:Uncharacterized protein n=1 Tax=Nesidiocoris tenuis TaxID=355587 RepID=A0A6H5GD91_9HEMI|nr:unnamed protein product [Nesidiocoris tenuis]